MPQSQSRIQDKCVQTMRPDGGVGSGFGGGECTHSFTRRQVTLLPLLVVTTYISGASQHTVDGRGFVPQCARPFASVQSSPPLRLVPQQRPSKTITRLGCKCAVAWCNCGTGPTSRVTVRKRRASFCKTMTQLALKTTTIKQQQKANNN